MEISRGWVLILIAAALFVSAPASAATRNGLKIKVLDSTSRSATIDDSGVPKNCDMSNFDAYCHNSKATLVTNLLLVQAENTAPFWVSCTVDSRWSRCVELPIGETYEAKKEKRGLTVYYVDDGGKPRSQTYSLVASNVAANLASNAAPPTDHAAEKSATDSAAEAGTSSSISSSSSRVEEMPAPKPAPQTAKSMDLKGTVKCKFSSTPPGADVTLDGRYVGSTPSTLGLSAGNHVVVVSMAGFTDWKRELTVTPESELSINAILKKAQ